MDTPVQEFKFTELEVKLLRMATRYLATDMAFPPTVDAKAQQKLLNDLVTLQEKLIWIPTPETTSLSSATNQSTHKD